VRGDAAELAAELQRHLDSAPCVAA
jgi:hypothetical protein